MRYQQVVSGRDAEIAAALSELAKVDRRQGGIVNDTRERQAAALKKRIKACTQCGPDMNVPGETESAPGYGSVHSPVVIVGQSLCGPCMAEQQPFYGGSGRLIDEALASVRIDKLDVFTTNVVHCHPTANRKSLRTWIDNCSPYLRTELKIVAPRLIIGLGKDARHVLQAEYCDIEPLPWPFVAPRAKHPLDLLFAPHPSHILKPWVQAQYPGIRDQWVTSLAQALMWSFASGHDPQNTRAGA